VLERVKRWLRYFSKAKNLPVPPPRGGAFDPFCAPWSSGGVGTKGVPVPPFGRIRLACGASNKGQCEERGGLSERAEPVPDSSRKFPLARISKSVQDSGSCGAILRRYSWSNSAQKQKKPTQGGLLKADEAAEIQRVSATRISSKSPKNAREKFSLFSTGAFAPKSEPPRVGHRLERRLHAYR
jgi:hypothetical protein